MKMADQIASEICGKLSFTSNRMVQGRMIGEQHIAHDLIADAIYRDRHEIARLRAALHKIQCDQLDQGTDKLLSALAHRRRAMKTRSKIIAVLANEPE